MKLDLDEMKINIYSSKLILKKDYQELELVFRESTQSDIDSIINISCSNERFKMSEYTNEIDKDELSFWVDDERSMVIVGDLGKDIVGYAIGFLISPKWFYFDAIMIKEGYRSIGLGKEMYKFIRESCLKNGVQLIHGLVKDDINSTLRYWENIGFEMGERFLWVEDWLD